MFVRHIPQGTANHYRGHQEQQGIIDAQNKKIEELEAKAKEVDELKAQMKEILEKLGK